MSIDGVPLSLLDSIGVVGVVLLVFVALIRGWLVTKREAEQTAHDRDEWRAESRLKDAQIAEKDKQLEHMGEVGRLVKDIMQSLQRWTPDKQERR